MKCKKCNNRSGHVDLNYKLEDMFTVYANFLTINKVISLVVDEEYKEVKIYLCGPCAEWLRNLIDE